MKSGANPPIGDICTQRLEAVSRPEFKGLAERRAGGAMPAPVQLGFFEPRPERNVAPKRSRINRLDPSDEKVHDWYRFVLSYPPHLVREYIRDFRLNESSVILDPFCGTGTTLVEAKLQSIRSVGIEANPFACFACATKTSWKVDPDMLYELAEEVARQTYVALKSKGIDDDFSVRGGKPHSLRTLSTDEMKLLLKNSISPVPLHKTLVLLDHWQKHSREKCYSHGLLALAKVLVYSVSNLHFGPEVGVKKIKEDTPVVKPWLSQVKKIADDIKSIQAERYAASDVYAADARDSSRALSRRSIDAVITSPPYPNEKDYTRTTRLESVLLGFIRSKEELREFKKALLRSNTRGVYKEDDDSEWVRDFPEILTIADEIEQRRIALRKTSGFERLYGKVETKCVSVYYRVCRMI